MNRILKKKLKEKSWRDWKFKDLIINMYKYFPDSRYSNLIVHKIIKTEKDRLSLVNQGYLIVEEHSDRANKFWYGLGPNGINLVNAWKTEKLTNEIKILTKALLLLTGVLVVLTVLQLYVVLIASP